MEKVNQWERIEINVTDVNVVITLPRQELIDDEYHQTISCDLKEDPTIVLWMKGCNKEFEYILEK